MANINVMQTGSNNSINITNTYLITNSDNFIDLTGESDSEENDMPLGADSNYFIQHWRLAPAPANSSLYRDQTPANPGHVYRTPHEYFPFFHVGDGQATAPGALSHEESHEDSRAEDEEDNMSHADSDCTFTGELPGFAGFDDELIEAMGDETSEEDAEYDGDYSAFIRERIENRELTPHSPWPQLIHIDHHMHEDVDSPFEHEGFSRRDPASFSNHKTSFLASKDEQIADRDRNLDDKDQEIADLLKFQERLISENEGLRQAVTFVTEDKDRQINDLLRFQQGLLDEKRDLEKQNDNLNRVVEKLDDKKSLYRQQKKELKKDRAERDVRDLVLSEVLSKASAWIETSEAIIDLGGCPEVALDALHDAQIVLSHDARLLLSRDVEMTVSTSWEI